jgi:hypothetical protein
LYGCHRRKIGLPWLSSETVSFAAPPNRRPQRIQRGLHRTVRFTVVGDPQVELMAPCEFPVPAWSLVVDGHFADSSLDRGLDLAGLIGAGLARLKPIVRLKRLGNLGIIPAAGTEQSLVRISGRHTHRPTDRRLA